MADKEYAFYPGCSSQSKASADNYLRSTLKMCDALGIKLNEIPDWNCCGASIGYAGGGEVPRISLSARNVALSQQAYGQQDIVATCAACWLNTKESQERVENSPKVRAGVEGALAEIGLKIEVDNMPKARHMVEVLIEDFGIDNLAKEVKKPLDGIKIAGYVGCQTNRPFGIAGESYENPLYLDHMVESLGAQAVDRYDKKVACCSGALMFSEPDKGHALVKDIIEAAYDGGADMIVTPCPLCQMNVEAYQPDINKRFGTKFNIPVVYYTQLYNVAFGQSVTDAALDGQIIKAGKLEEIANK
jgi:heterodisulfide reductase subunit B